MTSSSQQPEDYVVYEFADLYWEDREAGRQRTLTDYLARFPGHDEKIAREFLALRQRADAPDEDPRRDAPQAAHRIKQYRLERELGRGGQAVVHLAIDTRLDRPVALKVLRQQAASLDTAQLERLRREAQLISRLEHPGICPIYEADFDGEQPFLAMRYLPGETVEQRLRAAAVVEDARRAAGDATGTGAGTGEVLSALPRSSADVHRVLYLIERVARALHAAHQSGVIHRDVKPGNIMFDAEGAPVLLDFGLARGEGGEQLLLTAPGEVYGTLHYMSPEQIRSRADQLDRRTDVYSLGVTLFECLTLQRPFDADTREVLYHEILEGTPRDALRLNPHLPRDVATVLLAAMDRDPARRYPTALAFAEDLARIRNFEPILARPVSGLVRARRWMRRHPAATASIGLLIVGLAGTTWGLVSANRERKQAEIERVKADSERARFEALVEHFDNLALGVKLERAKATAADLYPAWPTRVGAMERWLAEQARPLVAQLASLRDSSDEIARLAAASEDPARALYPPDSVPFLRATLPGLVDELERFAATEVPDVERRLEWAREIAVVSMDAWAAEWDESIADIERGDGELTSAAYRGLRIEPQIGLIPLGPDGDSKLWEFYHLASAANAESIPERGVDGGFELSGDHGMVFVLLPGGTFTMGASPDRGDPNFDPHAQVEERPCERQVAPFFVSKYEMTQAQWERLSRQPDPSRYSHRAEGKNQNPSTLFMPILPTNPVENVTWEMTSRLLERHGLALPAEDQWEYACRAGTHGTWHTGRREGTLQGYANVADKTATQHAVWHVTLKLEDGHLMHAPVGSFRPNAFGLHDVHGNVSEWVGAIVDAEVLLEHSYMTPGEHMHRGGSFYEIPYNTRSARRMFQQPEYRDATVGVRPVRAVSAGAGR